MSISIRRRVDQVRWGHLWLHWDPRCWKIKCATFLFKREVSNWLHVARMNVDLERWHGQSSWLFCSTSTSQLMQEHIRLRNFLSYNKGTNQQVTMWENLSNWSHMSPMWPRNQLTIWITSWEDWKLSSKDVVVTSVTTFRACTNIVRYLLTNWRKNCCNQEEVFLPISEAKIF